MGDFDFSHWYARTSNLGLVPSSTNYTKRVEDLYAEALDVVI